MRPPTYTRFKHCRRLLGISILWGSCTVIEQLYHRLFQISFLKTWNCRSERKNVKSAADFCRFLIRTCASLKRGLGKKSTMYLPTSRADLTAQESDLRCQNLPVSSLYFHSLYRHLFAPSLALTLCTKNCLSLTVIWFVIVTHLCHLFCINFTFSAKIYLTVLILSIPSSLELVNMVFHLFVRLLVSLCACLYISFCVYIFGSLSLCACLCLSVCAPF